MFAVCVHTFQEFGEGMFSNYGSVLFCKICEIKVAAKKKFSVKEHEKNIRALEIKKKIK